MIKRIKKKGIVKQYRGGKKFFLAFDDDTKAMFPERLFDTVGQGDVLEFEGKPSNGWINSIDAKTFEVRIVKKADASATTTVEPPKEEEIAIEVNYLMKPRENKRGKMFTMARALEEQPAKVLYLPIFCIPEDIKEEVLAGYGTIKATGNFNGDTFFATKVLSFEPTLKRQTSVVELKDVRFSLYHISFAMDGKYISIPQEKVPFAFSPVFEKIKSELKGTIKVEGEFRKVGKFKKNKQSKEWEEQVSWIDNEEVTYDFSDVDTDSIKKIEEKLQHDIEYAKLMATLRANPAFTSMGAIKKLATSRGLKITTQQIEELYWDEKYDKEFYNTLKRKAEDIFVSNEEFVFTMSVEGREYRIVERPVMNSATYIFDDSCDKDLLLDRLKQTKRFDIIRNSIVGKGKDEKTLHDLLGYKGRVIHQDYSQWLHKIQKVIGDGVEKELIDRFIW